VRALLPDARERPQRGLRHGAGSLIGAAAFFQRELLGLAPSEPKVLDWPLTMLLSILAALAVGALGRRALRDPAPAAAYTQGEPRA